MRMQQTTLRAIARAHVAEVVHTPGAAEAVALIAARLAIADVAALALCASTAHSTRALRARA